MQDERCDDHRDADRGAVRRPSRLPRPPYARPARSPTISETTGRKRTHRAAAAARYGDDLARIKTLTTAVEDATAKETEACSAQIVSQVEAAIQTLRTRYPALDDAAFAAAVAPLNTLTTPPTWPPCAPTPMAVAGVAQNVAAALDVLSTTKDVRHVNVTDVWGGPITSAEDLETALVAAPREAVLAQLDDDTEVRFRCRRFSDRAANLAREARPERPRLARG